MYSIEQNFTKDSYISKLHNILTLRKHRLESYIEPQSQTDLDG